MSDVVKFFHSGMAGAPQMSNVLGQMITVLDACLLTAGGFNSLTPTSITRSAGIATVTYGVSHGYEIDQVLLVSGADQSPYNGEQRIVSIPSSTTLTFAVAGSPATPATSTTSLNTKTAPLGFAKPFSATNKAMYQSQNVTSNQWILRVDGTANGAYSSGQGVEYKVDICRTASGIDTMTENTTADAATYGRFRWRQSALGGNMGSAAPATNINWALYGNDKTFFFTVGFHSTMPLNHAIYGFGEVVSYKPADAYNTFLMAGNYGTAGGTVNALTSSTNQSFRGEYNRAILSSTGTQSDIILAKAHTGVGSWVQGGFTCVGGPTGGNFQSGCITGVSAVNPVDSSILFFKSYVVESSGFRGELPAMYAIPHQMVDVVATVDFGGLKYTRNIAGSVKTIRVCRSASNVTSAATSICCVGFDITGPW